MLSPWQKAQNKWNVWTSNSYHRKAALKAIGRATHHASRAFGFLPRDIQQDLMHEYARTQFEYAPKQKAA